MQLNLLRAVILLAWSGGLAYFLNRKVYSDLDPNLGSIAQPPHRASPPSTAARRPNVVFLQHESLAGAILLNTEKGRAATPFFQGRRRDDPDFYVFEHHRTGSGNTVDAMPALMTGCLPFVQKGVEFARTKGRSVGHAFAAAGYRTASFSSRGLDETLRPGGQWGMMYDMLVGGMDRVENPLDSRMRLDNGQGSSDGQMLPVFEKWLAELAGYGDPSTPFYAQFYNFNQHFPYLEASPPKLFSASVEGQQYYTSLKHTDLFLEGLFSVLSRTGQLENTVIVGSSDHGEDPFKGRYARLSAWNSNVLHGAAYIYYPARLMPHAGLGPRLRRNTQQLTYTLDMHPTLLTILHGASSKYRVHPLSDPDSAAAAGCIAGVDLTAVDVPEDRVVLSANVASNMPKSGTLWAISTKDASLYRRKAKWQYWPFRQELNGEYVLLHGECTRSTQDQCMAELDDRWKEHFRRVVVALRRGSGFVGEEVKESKLVQFFVDLIGGESAMKATEGVMMMEGSLAAKHKDGNSFVETAAGIVPIDSPYSFVPGPNQG